MNWLRQKMRSRGRREFMRRRTWLLATGVLLAAGCQADSKHRHTAKGQGSFSSLLRSANPGDDARAILERAIAAHGGADNLSRTLSGRLNAEARGSIAPAGDFTVRWEETFQLPGKYKRVLRGEMGGQVPIRAGGVMNVYVAPIAERQTEQGCVERLLHRVWPELLAW